jgi:hypothetical protein
MQKEELTHLERMIELHKKNLYILEEMLAKYGADQPLHLINSVTMEREAIARYTRQIDELDADTHAREKSEQLASLPRRPFFVGREAEIKAILKSLQPNSRTFIVGIEGIGGVGKSALAVEISHRCIEDDLFECVIWISAKESTLTLHGIEPMIPEAKSFSDILITCRSRIRSSGRTTCSPGAARCLCSTISNRSPKTNNVTSWTFCGVRPSPLRRSSLHANASPRGRSSACRGCPLRKAATCSNGMPSRRTSI